MFDIKHRINKFAGWNFGAVGCLLSLEEVKGSIVSMFKVAANRQAVKNLKAIKTTFTFIDDYIDEGNPKKFINLSTDVKESRTSEFLNHILKYAKENYINKKAVKNFFNLIETESPFSKDIINLGNLLCKEVQQELIYKEQGNRAKATEKHREISGLNIAIFSHVIRYMNKNSLPIESNITTDIIKQRYPLSFNIGKTSQILDDVRDVLDDHKVEKDSGLISSNYLITKLSARNELDNFLELTEKNKNFSSFTKLFKEIKDDIKKELADAPFSVKFSIIKCSETYLATNFSSGRNSY